MSSRGLRNSSSTEGAGSATRRVALVGAAFTGNQGAAAMLESVITRLPERVHGCDFTVMSHSPSEDRAACPFANVEIVPFDPRALVLAFLFALPAGVLRALNLPWRWLCVSAGLRALVRSSVVVDVSGISFSDSRGVPRHVYHFLLAAVPELLGVPIVKASQAIGPLETVVNRTLARIVLPRVSVICARGAITERELRSISHVTVERAADLAFLLQVSPAATQRVDGLLVHTPPGREMVAVLPSAVVDRYCRRAGIEYTAVLAATIDRLGNELERHVVIAPHSSLEDERPTLMNDRPICRAIMDRVACRDHVTLLDVPLTAGELRHLIGRSSLTLTSRFHAAISALETATPVVVTSWSHKYVEVLDEFDIADAAIDHRSMTSDGLWERLTWVNDHRADVEARIASQLPRVVASAEHNLDVIARTLDTAR